MRFDHMEITGNLEESSFDGKVGVESLSGTLGLTKSQRV